MSVDRTIYLFIYVYIYIYIWARAAGQRTPPPPNGMVGIVVPQGVSDIVKILRKTIVFGALRLQNIENPMEKPCFGDAEARKRNTESPKEDTSFRDSAAPKLINSMKILRKSSSRASGY